MSDRLPRSWHLPSIVLDAYLQPKCSGPAVFLSTLSGHGVFFKAGWRWSCGSGLTEQINVYLGEAVCPPSLCSRAVTHTILFRNSLLIGIFPGSVDLPIASDHAAKYLSMELRQFSMSLGGRYLWAIDEVRMAFAHRPESLMGNGFFHPPHEKCLRRVASR